MININSTTSQTRLNGCCCNFFEISLSISLFIFSLFRSLTSIYMLFSTPRRILYFVAIHYILFYICLFKGQQSTKSIYVYVQTIALIYFFSLSLFFIILLLFHLRIVLFVFYVQCNHISIIASSVSNQVVRYLMDWIQTVGYLLFVIIYYINICDIEILLYYIHF